MVKIFIVNMCIEFDKFVEHLIRCRRLYTHSPFDAIVNSKRKNFKNTYSNAYCIRWPCLGQIK